MSSPGKAAMAGMCVLAVGGVIAVVAPPSVFVREPNGWLVLRPVLLPALLGGPLLALVASALAVVSERAAAITAIAAAACSGVGAFVAWGIDARASGGQLVMFLMFLALPVLLAIEALRAERRGDNRRDDRGAG